jgi:hypothetical protein
VRDQRQNQRGRKSLPSGVVPRVYSLHAPEVECIGKGNAHRPYEFGVKVSVATTLRHSRGGQFIAHVKALPGNPYDGHTLGVMIPEMEAQIGANLEHVIGDRGHNAPPEHRFRVYICGQKRRVTEAIKRDLRRRSAVEPCIGHLKSEHRMGRNHLAHAAGDAANAVLAAAGYNFRRLLAWLAVLLRVWLGPPSSRPPNRLSIRAPLRNRRSSRTTFARMNPWAINRFISRTDREPRPFTPTPGHANRATARGENTGLHAGGDASGI